MLLALVARHRSRVSSCILIRCMPGPSGVTFTLIGQSGCSFLSFMTARPKALQIFDLVEESESDSDESEEEDDIIIRVSDFLLVFSSALNSYLIWVRNNLDWNLGKRYRSRLFLIELSTCLMKPLILRRTQQPRLSVFGASSD